MPKKKSKTKKNPQKKRRSKTKKRSSKKIKNIRSDLNRTFINGNKLQNLISNIRV